MLAVKREGCRSYCRGLVVRYWADFALLIIVFVVAQILTKDFMLTYDRFVLERDPSLSFPYVAVETIDDTELFVYLGLVPLIVLWITQFLVFKIWPDHELVQNPVRPTLTMLDSWAFALLFTNIMKCYAGRPRPNFFAYCNYKGYRDAMISGNYTDYFNATVFGRGMLASDCPLIDARHSFPSGHATFSMSSMLSLALFWYGVAELQRNHKLYKIVLCSMLPLCAWLVAGSRTRDYYHNYDDVLAGSVIGATSSVMCFFYSYNSRTRRGTAPNDDPNILKVLPTPISMHKPVHEEPTSIESPNERDKSA